MNSTVDSILAASAQTASATRSPLEAALHRLYETDALPDEQLVNALLVKAWGLSRSESPDAAIAALPKADQDSLIGAVCKVLDTKDVGAIHAHLRKNLSVLRTYATSALPAEKNYAATVAGIEKAMQALDQFDKKNGHIFPERQRLQNNIGELQGSMPYLSAQRFAAGEMREKYPELLGFLADSK